MVKNNLVGGWAYPSEKWWTWMESHKIDVPNHQPENNSTAHHQPMGNIPGLVKNQDFHVNFGTFPSVLST